MDDEQEGSAMDNPQVSFDLGDETQRERRLLRLDELAARFGITSSALLQKIGDGEFDVAPVEPPAHLGVSGDVLIALAGTWDFPPGAIEEMERAIEDAFEQVEDE